MNARAAALAVTAAVVVFHGRVIDRTTGQPLVGVRVDLTSGPATIARLRHGVSDADGRFVIRSLASGSYTFSFTSPDVPLAQETVRVDPGHTSRTFRECSTTLDYSCAPAAPMQGGGG